MHSVFMRLTKLRGCKVLSASYNSSPTSTCPCILDRDQKILQTKAIRLNPGPLLSSSPQLRLSFRRRTHHSLEMHHRRSRRHRASSQAFSSGHLPHYSPSIPRDETWHSILYDTVPHTDSEAESDESFSGTDSSCSSCSSIASLSTLEYTASEAG